MLTFSFIGLVVDWTWQIAHRMLRGKVQMGTFEQIYTRWINDGLLDCSPDDQVWGWSIRSTEILDQDRGRINDDVLRDMLYMALLDPAAETVWAEALNLRQSTRLTSNMVAQILQRIFKTDDKVRCHVTGGKGWCHWGQRGCYLAGTLRVF